jgi:single-strand DNA-binding protein
VANLNKVMLIGRLTRDPEVRTFNNGGKVAKFGFAVNNRKKNMQTGQWEEEPVFVDVEAFNRGDSGKQADLVEQYLAKGRQVYIEGHLKLDSWTAQDGQKRNRLLVVVDNIQFLDSRQYGEGSGGGNGNATRAPRPAATAGPRKPAPAYGGGSEYGDEPEPTESPRDEDIPF